MAISAGARAESGLPVAPVWLSDMFYASVAATGKHVELPRFQYLQRSDGGDAFAADPSVTGAGFAVVVGYTLDPSSAFLAGRRPRIELRAEYFGGRGTTDANLDQRGFIYLMSNDLAFGPVGSADLFGTGRVTSTLHAFDGALVYKFDLATGPRMTVSPSFGLFGGYAVQRSTLSLEYFAVDDPSFRSPGFVKDDLRTARIGGQLGLDIALAIGPRVTLLAAFSGALYYQHTSYSAQECQNFAVPYSPMCKGDAWRSSVTDSDDTWGLKLSGLLGVAYDLGFARVSVAGTLAWDTRMPGARHPRVDDFRVASIKYEGELSYGGRIAVAIPLPLN